MSTIDLEKLLKISEASIYDIKNKIELSIEELESQPETPERNSRIEHLMGRRDRYNEYLNGDDNDI